VDAPATLNATQQAVALSARRFRSLALIMGGARTARVRFNPLLEQLLTASWNGYIAALGDAGSYGDQTSGRAWERVLTVTVTVTGSRATMLACERDSVAPAGGASMDRLVLVKTDLGSSWRTTVGPDRSTAADQTRCQAWASYQWKRTTTPAAACGSTLRWRFDSPAVDTGGIRLARCTAWPRTHRTRSGPSAG
jgi:hypothetical protein